MSVITRKIEIFVSESDSDKRKGYYKTLREWSYVSRNYANDVMNTLQSARFLDNLIKDTADENLNSLSSYLETSKRNVGYKMLANKYKELLPSSYRTCINSYVFSNFNNTIKEVLRGDRAINSYKKDFPLLFMSKSIRNLSLDDLGGSFEFYSIPFRFNFGRDKSNNKSIVEKILTNQYKMCDSSIKFDGTKLFMFLVVNIPDNKISLDEGKVMGVDLGLQYPAYVSINNNTRFRQSIGNAETFLNVRLSLQKQKRSLQANLKDAKGGRGRNNKLAKLNDIGNKERNFAKTMNHTFSKQIIDLAIKNNCGTINIEDLKGFGKNDKNGFVLRNWSFFELQSFIQYKADKVGIKVNVVNPRYSSQRCNKCGHIHEDNRQTQSKFECTSCGYSDNADYNASKNISIAHTKEYKKEIEIYIKNKEKVLQE